MSTFFVEIFEKQCSPVGQQASRYDFGGKIATDEWTLLSTLRLTRSIGLQDALAGQSSTKSLPEKSSISTNFPAII